MSVNGEMIFIQYNGYIYEPVTEMRLQYVGKKLHAIFQDVTGEIIDAEVNKMKFVHL